PSHLSLLPYTTLFRSHVGSPPPTYAELSRSRFGGCCWVPGGNGGSGRRGTSEGSTCGGCWPLTPHVRRPPRMRWGGRLICYPGRSEEHTSELQSPDHL